METFLENGIKSSQSSSLNHILNVIFSDWLWNRVTFWHSHGPTNSHWKSVASCLIRTQGHTKHRNHKIYWSLLRGYFKLCPKAALNGSRNNEHLKCSIKFMSVVRVNRNAFSNVTFGFPELLTTQLRGIAASGSMCLSPGVKEHITYDDACLLRCQTSSTSLRKGLSCLRLLPWQPIISIDWLRMHIPKTNHTTGASGFGWGVSGLRSESLWLISSPVTCVK